MSIVRSNEELNKYAESKIDKVTSTDNAIVRFDGATGQVQDSSIRIDDNGNLNITGVGKRITGDFSNTTDSSRVSFESNVLNSYTVVNAFPNGTGPLSAFRAFNTQSGLNSSFTEVYCDPSQSMVRAGRSGTGSYLPMTFNTNGAERVRIDTAGNVGIGTSSPSNNLHISSATEAVVKLQNTGAGGCWLRLDPVTASYIWGYTNTPIIFGTNNSERARFTPNGYFLLTSGTGALGYGTGSGGTVTQLTSKSTNVTLNKPTGTIITNSAALAVGETAQFSVVCSLVQEHDTIQINCKYAGGSGSNYDVNTVSNNGDFVVQIKNKDTVSRSDVVYITYTIIKGATV